MFVKSKRSVWINFFLFWNVGVQLFCFSHSDDCLFVHSLSCVWLFATHWLQHVRLPCLSPTPGACSNSCPLSLWCHPTILSSVTPFFSCPQSFSASGSFPLSQFFASGGQSIAASASASVLPMNIQGWFPLGLTGWSPCCPRDSQESSPAPQFESINSSVLSLLYGSTLTSVHNYWKKHNFDYMGFSQQSDISAFFICFLGLP